MPKGYIKLTDYQLEERTCKGGCDRSFKVLPKSDQWYARSDCEHVCFGVARTKKERKALVIPPFMTSRKDRAKTIVEKGLEQLLEDLIKQVKLMEIKDLGAKLDVAYLAIEAKRLCGSTYPDFGKACDLKNQDLYAWIAVHEKIVKVLPLDLLQNYTMEFLIGASKDMREGMSKSEVTHLLQIKLMESEVHHLVEHKEHLAKVRAYFMNKNLDHLNKRELDEVYAMIKDLSKKFRFWVNKHA